MANITKRSGGITIAGKNYTFEGKAEIIDNNSAHIFTDQGMIFVDTTSTVDGKSLANISTLLTDLEFSGTTTTKEEGEVYTTGLTQTQADQIATNTAKAGIASAAVSNGRLTISLTDGTTPINSVNVVGPTGNTGLQGIQGRQGITGQNGSNGIQGAIGSNGAQGATGGTGGTGTQGIAGTNGSNGGTGLQGTTGARGTQGTTGTTPTISIGQTYSTAGGSAAVQTYVTGNNTELRFFIPTGAQGAAGATGVNGSNGAQGATGATGATGTSGVNGSNGAQGIQGPAGADGTGGGDGGGGVIGVKTNSEAFSAEIDEEGTAFVNPIGLTTDVRVTDGRSPIILSFTDGILTNIYLDKL